MIRFDAKAIEKDVSIQEVLRYFGQIPTKDKYHCINKHHNDKNPSMNIYKNRCKCFACGKSFGPISAVMELDDKNFPAACQFLIEEFGLDSDIYSEVDDRYNTKVELKDKFPLTYAELKILNWDMGSKYMELYDEEGNVYEVLKDVPTLKDLYKEQPDIFYQMLQEKIEKALIPRLKIKLDSHYFFLKEVKEYAKKYKDFDICRQMIKTYKEMKENGATQDIIYQKDYFDLLVSLLSLEQIECDYKDIEKEVSILNRIMKNIPDKYRNKTLEQNVKMVHNLYVYTPNFSKDNQELENIEEIENEADNERE